MITPAYKIGITPNTKDKFYCSYVEEYCGEKFSRYLTPTGWSHVCHYFDTQQEAEDTFNRLKAATNPLPVTEEEYIAETNFRRSYIEDFEMRYAEDVMRESD